MKWAIFAVLLVWSGAAQAAVFPPITIQEMIEQSVSVVRAEVLVVDEMAYDFENKQAYTKVALKVLETLSGEDLTGGLTLTFRGGLVPDSVDEEGGRSVWDIVPDLDPGQTYVLFLRADEYFITPLVSQYVLKEVNIFGHRVLITPEGRLVSFTDDFPQVGEHVDDTERKSKNKGRVPSYVQTEEKAFDVIRRFAEKPARNKSGEPLKKLPRAPSPLPVDLSPDLGVSP